MNTTNSNNVGGPGSLFCVDIGNNAIKSAVYANDNWQVKPRIGHDEIDRLANWINNAPEDIQIVLVSSVVDSVFTNLTQQEVNAEIISVTRADIPENKIDYKTPETLGLDRYLACLGAYKQVNNAVIVVDAGTACTVDLMDHNGIFQGGVIMPGISLFEKSLKENAKALPVVERQLPSEWPGKSTKECIQWGIVGSFVHAVEGHINEFLKNIETDHIFVTGGDAHFLFEHMSYEVREDPLLVMKGLVTCYEEEIGHPQ